MIWNVGLSRQFYVSNEMVGVSRKFDQLTGAQSEFLRGLPCVSVDFIELEAIDLFGIDLFHEAQTYRIYPGNGPSMVFALVSLRL